MADPEGGLKSTEDQEKASKVTDSNQETLQTPNDEDPEEAARLARIEADRETIRQEEREALRREYEEQRTQERKEYEQQQQAAQLLNSFGSTVREVRENLKKLQFWDDNGNRRSLSDNEIEELVVRPVSKYNLTGRQAEALRLQSEMADQALKTIPESKREDFIKRASGKPLNEWFDVYVEMRAENSEWAKRMEKEKEAAVKAAEARAAAKAKNSPATPPSTGDSNSKSGTSDENDLNSLIGLLRARREGKVPDEVFYPKFKELNRR